MKKILFQIIFLLIFFIVLNYPLNYYIYTGGGTLNAFDKVYIENENKSQGTFNLVYVSQSKANVLMYLLSFINKEWDVVSIDEYRYNNESLEDLNLRDKLNLDKVNSYATFLAYRYSNIDIEYNKKLVVSYSQDKNIKIGDIIIEIDNNKITDFNDILNITSNKNFGDKVFLKLMRNNNIIDTVVDIKNEKNRKIIGINIDYLYEFKNNLATFKFESNEYGPSGGLAMVLTMYDKLNSIDLTKGKKIAVTGAIDKDGNVIDISGIKYKLQGAVKDKATIFIVPEDNYEEAIKVKNKYKYNIDIVKVKKVEDAINFLKDL